MTTEEVLALVADTLTRYAYRYASEAALHVRLETLLSELGLAYTHEHRMGLGRFDFLLPAGVVLEVKVGGALGDALRQAARYCQEVDVQAVLILSTTLWARNPTATTFSGKPVQVVYLQRAAF